MKRYASILFLFFLTFGYGQDTFDKVNNSYEEFLSRLAKKDTLIKNRTKYYECSESFSGRIEFYFQEKELRLIQHIYKQGFGNDVFLENYFIEKDTLRLKTSISEIIHLNSLYLKSSQGSSSTTIEKVVEVIENRMFFKKDLVTVCYERRHGEKMSEWNQEYFEALAFEKGNCIEDVEDIRYKYRLLRKAETRLQNYSNRKRACIFHMW
ncbi:hypothetical protein [Aquimarina algiphila]|uniref:Uncharacterized protein n=1 Tax=Aquimarina algiphila TaxID=2047982 RepID=A0A554VN86_9FLAO|nr:hypothetical protein [Aquimarina algiphila]TSE09804.1 hypothetical protein FOF46_07255 [Aquimarina algiphila]